MTELHEKFAECTRIAVGVSVVDSDDEAVLGFHRVLPRDGAGGANRDLSASASTKRVPVIGVTRAPDQPEYGDRAEHAKVHEVLDRWLGTLDCARLPLDSRLDAHDWRHCATPDQFMSVLARLDAVVSTCLHGLVLGLRTGIPVLAVDPIHGGGEVSAQAELLRWPVVGADEVGDPEAMARAWRWCRSADGTYGARESLVGRQEPLIKQLIEELRGDRAA